MAFRDAATGDYITTSLQAGPAAPVEQAALVRLQTRKGSYWADPTLGSELYRLTQAKDVANLPALAKRWVLEALEPLKRSHRVSVIVVTVAHSAPSRLDIRAELTRADGRVAVVTLPVPITG